MKKISYKIVSGLIICILLISCVAFNISAAGTTISLSKTKPQVNDTLSITVTLSAEEDISAIGFSLNYNPDVIRFENGDSCTGGAGIVRVVKPISEIGKKKVSVTLNFTAIKSGSSTIQVTEAMYASSAEHGIAGASATLTVSDAAKPGVATLKSLSISNGTLTPGFSTGRTSYTAKVKYEVTSCKVFATATDAKATVAVGGKEALAVGKNTRTVTVTAQNGTQKTYTIVITRMAEGEKTGEESKPEDNTASTDNSAVIDGVKYSIATDLSGFKLPNGFKATTASRGGAEVAVAQDTDANFTVYYLKGENSESYLPYILEADGETFKKLKYATFGNNTYIFADIPEDKSIPDGFYPSSVKIGDFDITAYKSPDESLSDFYYTYCFFDKGFGFYRYDSAEGVLQRSPEFKLSDTNAEEPKSGGFISRFGSLSSNAKIIVIGIAVLIIGAVMLVIMLIRRVVKLGDYSDDDAYDRDMFTGGFDSVTVEDGSTGAEEEENTEKITK